MHFFFHSDKRKQQSHIDDYIVFYRCTYVLTLLMLCLHLYFLGDIHTLSNTKSGLKTVFQSGVFQGPVRQVKRWQFSGHKALKELPVCPASSGGCQAASFHCDLGLLERSRRHVKIPKSLLLLPRFSPFPWRHPLGILVSLWLISRVLKSWF